MEHTAATAPAADPIDLKVNGAAARVAVAPATPLLLVLRNDLALNGPNTVAAWASAAPAPC